MAILDLSMVGGWSRGACLLALWMILSWSIWSITLTEKRYRVLDLLPFAINCLGLTGSSYEGVSTDWRVWTLNMMLGGFLSLASSLSFHQELDIAETSLIVIGTFASVAGAIMRPKAEADIVESFDRKIAFLKVGSISISSILIVWGILTWKGVAWYRFFAQALCGASVIISSFASLVFVRQRKSLGVGSPLLWLFLRVMLAAGVDFFWGWGLLTLVSFSFLNFHHNRVNLWGALKNHWRNWQRLENFNASVSLTGAMILFLLVLNGSTAIITIRPPLIALQTVSHLESGLSAIAQAKTVSCSADTLWRILALDSFSDFTSKSISDPFSPHVSRVEHFMFEESAAIALVALLLISSVAAYIRKAKDPQSVQGFWQPIFFFSVSMMILIVSYSEYETVGYLAGWMEIDWADDGKMAVSLSFLFFLFSFSVSAFRVNANGVLERERTPFKKLNFESFRPAGLLLIGLLFLSSLLSFGQYFRVFERERPLSFSRHSTLAGVKVVEDNTTLEAFVSRLEPYLRTSDRAALTSSGINCTNRDQCLSSLYSLERNSNCTWNHSMNLPIYKSMLAVQTPNLSYNLRFGISDLLQDEILALAVLQIASIFLVCGGIILPSIDDFGLIITGVGSTLMTIAIPYRLKEASSHVFIGILSEWFIPIISVLQFLMSCVSVLQRVESPHKFVVPWVSVEEFMDDFGASEFRSYSAFIEFWTSVKISPSVSKAEEAYNLLKKRENAKLTASEKLLGEPSLDRDIQMTFPRSNSLSAIGPFDAEEQKDPFDKDTSEESQRRPEGHASLQGETPVW